MKIGEWIKSHKGAAIAIVAVLLFVLYELFKGGGSGSSGGSSLAGVAQIANLQASQNVQMAQLQAQQSVAQAQAQVANNQTQAQLAANEQNALASLLGPALQESQASQAISAQQQMQLQAEQAQLSAVQELTGKGSNLWGANEANIVADVLGQGNTASFNNAYATQVSAAEQAATLQKIGQYNLLNNLTANLGNGLGVAASLP